MFLSFCSTTILLNFLTEKKVYSLITRTVVDQAHFPVLRTFPSIYTRQPAFHPLSSAESASGLLSDALPSMLSMHTSYFTHPDLNDSDIQRESHNRSDIPIPSLSIRGSVIRGSTSSASTGVSTDDASIDSLDWNGEKSPSVDQEHQDYEQVKEYSHFDIAQLDDIMEMPKVEELEELDDDLLSIKQADVESGAPAAVPRKRGRPRKHPLPTPGGQAKITKGRSKTGCITCRRRKKKCDETKPS